jgi:ABC-type maltose transport system permease subunit
MEEHFLLNVLFVAHIAAQVRVVVLVHHGHAFATNKLSGANAALVGVICIRG